MPNIPCPIRPWRTLVAAAAGLLLTFSLPAQAQTHVDNPFVGASWYVNPDFTARAEASAAATADAALAAAMRQVGGTPTAVWIDDIAQVSTMTTHLDRALAAGSDLVLFVLHDLPGKGCDASIDSELQLDSAGLATYKTQFIDSVAAIARQPRYAGLRIVFVIEPGALPSLVTSLSVPCTAGDGPSIYIQSIQYAVNTLHAIPNAYLYLDLAHAAWLGWSENAGAAVALLGQVAAGFTEGKSTIDGFSINVKDYVPTREPYLTGEQVIGGQKVLSSRFFDWNPQVDDASYAASMWSRLTTAGWPTRVGFLSDTSRNGWGGPLRPAGPPLDVFDVNAYVDASRLDRRNHRNLWCNQAGAGLGQAPRAAPAEADLAASHYHAFAWVKVPGQSDGASADIYDDYSKYIRMCDPAYVTPYGVLTGALSGAPYAGAWFPDEFAQLIQNAWPPVAEPVAFTLTVTRTGGGAVVSAPAGITCGSSCSASFAAGTQVTLTAVAVPSSFATFAGWAGACEGAALTCVVSMTQARSVAATFVGGPGVSLTVARSGLGTGTVVSSPAGILCGSTCSALYGSGQVVTLTAVPASGSVFSSWGGDCSGSGSTCVLTMTASRSVVANFGGPPPTYVLTVAGSGTGTGTITSVPAGIDCGTTCSASFPKGAVVTLTAVPAASSAFAGWTGACAGSSTTCLVSMSQSRSVTATFTAPSLPCSNARTFTHSTGSFGTTGPVCYRTSQKVNGWGCANVNGRTVSVNGGPARPTCGAGPFPLTRAADGYTYFSVTAGTYPWASIYAW